MVDIVYTRKDLFNVLTETSVSNKILWDISYDDLLNILFSVYEEIIKEEDKLLGQAIRESEYRKKLRRKCITISMKIKPNQKVRFVENAQIF